ncbi:MAG TPA: methylthioribulose 1-phosphate dehydratase [Pseudomonadales bacterium]|nr:methylthioribulose 1-phosphate dehydratase [Pseudomonadales bacterium]
MSARDPHTSAPPSSSPQTPASGRVWRDEGFRRDAGDLGRIAAELHARGWTPATSSNFSFRIDADHCAVTLSGRDKARLGADDLLVVRLDGTVVDALPDARPSAETGLHTALYRRDATIGAVLHTHAPRAVLAPMFLARDGELVLEGYELLKAFAGNDTHETRLRIPVLANSQDIDALADEGDRRLAAQGADRPWAYLIEGHGVYVWGPDLAAAARHLEALDYLLGLELERHRLAGGARA